MRTPRPAVRPAVAAALDIGCVLVFVVIGRASHAQGETAAGIASTLWPFLAGLGLGWVIAALVLARSPKPRSYRARPSTGASPGDDPRTPDPRAWRHAGGLFPAGVVVWLGTVAFGMVLRVVSGQGTATSFIIVALAFLALFLLGWRGIAGLASRRNLASGRAR
ncbi:MAG: DUF3054 domain-containing protein [Nocardiopsaceae bacterium]|nr:DUF3054 domain-containing protein [Nocardiopsaceae bacterium]